jgi:hypothetical protein
MRVTFTPQASVVMMSCEGISITCCFMFILAPTRSITGTRICSPGLSVRV